MSSKVFITPSNTKATVGTATSVSATAVTTSITLALPDVIAMVWASDLRPASATLPMASFNSELKEGPPVSAPLFPAPDSTMRARLA